MYPYVSLMPPAVYMRINDRSGKETLAYVTNKRKASIIVWIVISNFW